MQYTFDWGDGTAPTLTDPVSSGTTASASHSWINTGNYQIKVMATKGNGISSEWSDPLEVEISTSNPPQNKCLGGSGRDKASSIQQTADGGYIVAGITSSNDGDVSGNNGLTDAWVAKLDSNKAIQWQRCLGTSEMNDQATSIFQTADEGYIVSGYSEGTNWPYGNTAWAAKLSSRGGLEWQKPMRQMTLANSILQTSEGGYIVAGGTEDNYATGNFSIIKLASNGATEWQTLLGGSKHDGANSIQQTTDGGYIVAGYADSNDGNVSGNHGSRDYWVVKLDSNGILDWQRCFGGSSSDVAYSIQQTTDGGYIVAGCANSNDGDVSLNQGGNDYWVVKLNSEGTLDWQRCIGSSQYDYAYSIRQTADGGYIVAGSGGNDGDFSASHGGSDFGVVKLDSSGATEWKKCLGGTGDDQAYGVQQTSDMGYIIAGFTKSNDGDVSGNHGDYDFWVTKIEPEMSSDPIVVGIYIENNRNAISPSELVPIEVRVTRNNQPIAANIELKINDQIVSISSESKPTYQFGVYPYQFGPRQEGTYNIEAIASNGGVTGRCIAKIEVIGANSRLRELISKLETTALAEIDSSEKLAASNLAEVQIDSVNDIVFVSEFIKTKFPKFLYDVIKSEYPDFVASWGARVVKTLINLIMTPIESLNNSFLQILNGNIITKINTVALELLYGNIGDDKKIITKDSNDFKKLIETNSPKLDSDKFKVINVLFKAKIDIVDSRVEDCEVIPWFSDLSTESKVLTLCKLMSDAKNKLGDSICAGAFAGIGFITAGQVAKMAGVIPKKYSPQKLITIVSNNNLVKEFGSALSKGMERAGAIWTVFRLIMSSLAMQMVPAVCDDIMAQHSTSIADIRQVLYKVGTQDSSYAYATDTILGIPSKINTSGLSFLISPDGRIIGSFKKHEDFDSLRAGTYSLMVYPLNSNSFAAKLSSFKVSKPNLNLNISHALQNGNETIYLEMRNSGSINLDNVTSMLVVRNTSNDIVFFNLSIFSIDAGETKNLSYTMNFVNPDIYIATDYLSVGSLDVIEEKKITIPLGITNSNSAIILDMEYDNEYPAQNNVTMNATMESLSPGLEYNISIPLFNYTKAITLTGTQIIDITLPMLEPGYYTIDVIAENNGNILDSRSLSFYVKADGTGILTFDTRQIMYNAGQSSAINLSLNDLNLSNVDAEIGVTAYGPLGGERYYSAIKMSNEYQFNFTPEFNGTYILEAHASKRWWRIETSTFTVIVGQMSPLNMSVTMGEYILANVTANGQPAACNVTIYTPQGNESVITSNGLALFNATNQFYIVADKMFFEPAFYSFKPYNISGTKFNDSNFNATRDPGEAGLSGWTIRLTRPDGTSINATTDASGGYKFENLTSGTYRVSEVRQDNWTQTYPAWLGDHIINVTDGNVTGVDFGNNYLPVPDIPYLPSGPASGIPGAEYSYSTSAADPSGYQIYYTFDWGDGSNSTTGLFDSGATASAAHIWNSSGVYQVRAMATNSKGASSGWSEALEVDIAAGIAADKIGVFRNGPWYIDYNGNQEWDPDSGDVSFWFGTGGDLPFAGDWSGDDVDEIGVFRNGPWYIDHNGNKQWDPDSGDVSFWFGTNGDLPIAGDWNGDGEDEIGVFRNGPWYLDYNGNRVWDPDSGDVSFWFGTSGDLPIAGDWNGDGKDEIGVFRNGPWYLDYNGNREWDPDSGDVSFWFGTSGDAPLAGDWNSDGLDEIGVFRNGPWYLDYNGNREWDPASGDVSFWFGTTGDKPVAGRWGSLSSSLAPDQDKPQLDLRETSAEKIRQKRAVLEELQEKRSNQIYEIKIAQETLLEKHRMNSLKP